MNNQNPTVFISHASEDKKIFVNSFVHKLRDNGVKVWVDDDQLLPGDKLIEKIFDEGIGEADVFIIVLSKNSVNKPWVKEELEFGYIRRINRKLRIIPIVIDDCEIPSFLKSTVWIKIEDVNNYDNELDRVIKAIFDIRIEKPLGEPPKYSTVLPLDDLSRIDTIILQASCEISVKSGYSFVKTSELLAKIHEYDIVEEQVFESLEFLDEKGFIEGEHTINSRGIAYFKITPLGFENYGDKFLVNFENTVIDIILSAMNEGLTEKSTIATYLKIPEGLVYHILLILEMRGIIKVQQYIGGKMEITKITAYGKRIIRNY